ncbi:MAG: glycosyltransferase family 9 protein [Bacteroidota bacterium]|nr:glycosyltransferase family 9 protein [Bacteroidota bacterium]
MKKFLIIQTAFIGDVVLATPLIEKLHAFFPDAQIDFLLRKGNEALLLHHPFLHEVLIWDKKEHKQRNLFRLIRRIRRNRYDKVVNLQRFAATGLLTAFSAAGETIGFDKNPLSFLFTKKISHIVGEEKKLHETERNLELIRHFTDPSYFRPVLYPSGADEDFVKPFKSGKFITVSPASVWFTKQYPADQWISFIKRIPAGNRILLMGGPGDLSLCEAIRASVGGIQIEILAGKLTLLQSAALMKAAVMNYVNDSAPLHFASAMNAPVTAVYCSTIPEFGFGPLSDIRFIVQIRASLYCRPCGLHGYRKCPEGHFRCAKEIKDEQLLKPLS